MGYTPTQITSKRNAKLNDFHAPMRLSIVVIPLSDLKKNIGKSPTTVIAKTVEGRKDFIIEEGPILADPFVITQNLHFFLACFGSQIFFIVNGLGNKTHTNHVKLTKEVSSYPGKLLSLEEMALVKDIYLCKCGRWCDI